MRKLLISLPILCLMSIFGLTSIYAQKKIAIMEPFCKNNAVSTFYITMIRGVIESAVSATDDYEAYDRTAFDQIVKEQTFQHSGMVSDADIKHIGELVGVDYILVTETSVKEELMYVGLKVLNVETGKYDRAEYSLIPMNEIPNFRVECKNLACQLFRISDYSKTIYFRNGTYKGQVKDDKPHGKGVIRYNSSDNRDSYNGEWANGSYNGQGTMIWRSGNKYVGQWQDGEIHGTGIYYMNSGDTLNGNFVSGSPVHCTWIRDNGDKYEGDFKDWKADGEGIETRINGEKYIGQFSGGRFNGQGKKIFSAEDALNRVVYEGEWRNDKYDGAGIMKWRNGSRYEGNWSEDKRQGEGVMYFSSGDSLNRLSYDGKWENDVPNGKGMLLFTNGDRCEGIWRNGHRNGFAIETSPDGKIEEGYYENDLRNGEWTRSVPKKRVKKAIYSNGIIIRDWH